MPKLAQETLRNWCPASHWPAGRAHDLDCAQGGDPDRTPAREDRHQRRDPDHGIAARRRGRGNFCERHRGPAARAGKV